MSLFINGSEDLSAAREALGAMTLRPRAHPEVRAVADELRRKRSALKTLRENRRRMYARKTELEKEFKAALKGEGGRDPRTIREERVELEHEQDHYHEKRLILAHEVATLEEKLEAVGREVAGKVEADVEAPMKALHAALVGPLEKAARVALALHTTIGHMPTRYRLPYNVANWPRRLPHEPASVVGFLGKARRLLRDLRAAGYDVDEVLIDDLEDL